MEEQKKGVKNYNVAVKKRGDDITFLRKIIRGGADESYGIEVAGLAASGGMRGSSDYSAKSPPTSVETGSSW